MSRLSKQDNIASFQRSELDRKDIQYQLNNIVTYDKNNELNIY